jgi:membrane associated rhomboid family serine protease
VPPRYPTTSTRITLSVPPFTGIIKRLVLANILVFFALDLVALLSPSLWEQINGYLDLTPALVLPPTYFLWQLVTYGFIHATLMHIFFNMLTLWFIGGRLEADFGARWLGENYFVSLIGAGLCTIGVSYLPLPHVGPLSPTVGASGAIFGLLAAFAVYYGEQEMMLFFVLRMKAKYIVILFALFSVAMLLTNSGNVAYAAHLGGLAFGYLYAKLAPRRGFSISIGDGYFGMRNAWYRHKRRQAAKKFEVYMGKPNGPTHLPDPDTKRDPNDRRWMN